VLLHTPLLGLAIACLDSRPSYRPLSFFLLTPCFFDRIPTLMCYPPPLSKAPPLFLRIIIIPDTPAITLDRRQLFPLQSSLSPGFDLGGAGRVNWFTWLFEPFAFPGCFPLGFFPLSCEPWGGTFLFFFLPTSGPLGWAKMTFKMGG